MQFLEVSSRVPKKCMIKPFQAGTCCIFNKTTLLQLKDVASAVLAREKSTSLAELFSAELKFTIDTLNDWFSNVIKPKFFELNDIKQQIFIKENPIVPSKTTCSICGFLLDVKADSEEHKNWYDFIIECEHLFLRNIYSSTDLKEMDVDTTEKYLDIIYRLLKLSPMFARALDSGDMSDEF